MAKQIPREWFLNGRLKLRQLTLVRAIGEKRNLRRAAAALHMAQPAATKLLHDLEATLGVPLFDRSRRGMTPTIYGDAMIRYAELLIADLDAAREEIGALASGLSGRLNIGTLTSIAPVLLPRAIALIKRERPGLRIVVQESNHDALLAMLARSEIDLMLARAAPATDMPDLRYELLDQEEFRVVAGVAHPLVRKRKLSLSAIVDEAWVLPHDRVLFRHDVDALFLAAAGRRPANVIESVSLLTNQTLLQEMPVLGILPAATAERYARQKLLSVLPVRLGNLKVPVAMMTRDSRESPALLDLMAALRQVAAQLQAEAR